MGKQKRIQHYLQTSPFPTFICDGNRQIIFANEAISSLSGYPVANLIGQNPGRLLQGEETDPTTVRRVRKHLDAGVPFEFSITNYHQSGHSFHIGVFVIPFLEGSESEKVFVGVSRELSSIEESALSGAPREFGETISQVLSLVDEN